jgi:uncharacterized protein (TIGR02145 family)
MDLCFKIFLSLYETIRWFFVAAISIALVFTFSACTKDDDDDSSGTIGYSGSYGSVSHSGQTYKTIVIGTQVWMAENLNYDVEGSGCYDDSDNCTKYGRVYNWVTTMALPSYCDGISGNLDCSDKIQTKHQGICPDGWHIPRDAEWAILTDYVGGESTAGVKLKATNGWQESPIYGSMNGTDVYGFAALPGGGGDYSCTVNSNGVGLCTSWWSATQIGMGNKDAYDRSIGLNSKSLYRNHISKSSFSSVRCIQD